MKVLQAVGIIVFALLSQITYAKTPFPVNAKSALVIDADTNKVIIGKNAEQVRPIASITKLMTAVIILDANLPLDKKITITQAEVKATMVRGRRTSTTLPVGTTLTRAQLLHLALMNSQNRAAYALARTYPGGVQTFVATMNAKAQMLGMDNTHYVDPTGLFNTNVSTAHDLAILVRHASDYVLIRDFSTAVRFELTLYYRRYHQKRAFGTTNRLVAEENWDIVLQKTGYIRDAGHCVAMLATMGTRRVVVVLLDATSNNARARDADHIKKYVETGEIPKVHKRRHHYKRHHKHRKHR